MGVFKKDGHKWFVRHGSQRAPFRSRSRCPRDETRSFFRQPSPTEFSNFIFRRSAESALTFFHHKLNSVSRTTLLCHTRKEIYLFQGERKSSVNRAKSCRGSRASSLTVRRMQLATLQLLLPQALSKLQEMLGFLQKDEVSLRARAIMRNLTYPAALEARIHPQSYSRREAMKRAKSRAMIQRQLLQKMRVRFDKELHLS